MVAAKTSACSNYSSRAMGGSYSHRHEQDECERERTSEHERECYETGKYVAMNYSS